MVEIGLDVIVRGMINPPEYIPNEVKNNQFRVDYSIAMQDFRISHKGELHNVDFASRWIANYMKRHYGYKIK